MSNQPSITGPNDSPSPANRTELNPATRKALEAFRQRRRWLLALRSLGIASLVFVSLTMLLATADFLFIMPDGVRWVFSILIYAATVGAIWFAGVRDMRHGDPIAIAKHVEAASPILKEELVSAVELAAPESSNGAAYFRGLLQTRVARRLSQMDLREALPLALIRRWLVSGGLVTAMVIALLFVPSAQFGRRLARAALPGFSIERASRTRIEILRPSPPTGYVAERDAIGVVVRVTGETRAEDEVTLHWRRADGASGESLMTPRRDTFDQALTDGVPSPIESNSVLPVSYSANLSVGSDPVEYRVTAGDGVTLWHQLTPLPRPRVTRYEKLYRLPEYARLADRTADEEHGDLKALQDTTAEVIVTFDQPVEDAVLRYGLRGTSQSLQPIDEEGTRYLARISMTTSGEYQVDATSRESGLNNPFSPMHRIMPVVDSAPKVRWGEEVAESLLVSPLSVLEMSAEAEDDLPLDQLVQEIQVNEEKIERRIFPVDAPKRELMQSWSWDLMHRLGDSTDANKLATGDLVRTRMVAIDRKRNRAETQWVELLIADDGFDVDRHRYLEQFAKRVDTVSRWAEECEALARGLN
ncbi:MAG: hypothetical protein AAFV88_21470, partial [Planctomycetota bacterium]